MIEIIEDCSPYFIRYKHTNSDSIIDLCRKFKAEQIDSITEPKKRFLHHRLPADDGLKILEYVPANDIFQFNVNRVSLFVTQPGFYYRPHKDGLDCRFGINYIVDVRDNLCQTSWYDDEQFEGRPITDLDGPTRSREIADYNRRQDRLKIFPVKSMVAKENEVMLFNVDIYHDVNNVSSKNERTILTLRTGKQIKFEDARKILFGY
jgi:hypothetical protein